MTVRIAPRYILVFTLSYAGLLWERLWNRLWPVASLFLFFIALSLIDIPMIFGAVWHLLFLAFFAAALVAAFLRAGAPFFLPTREAVERRMEKTGGLGHRPLAALRDKPAAALPEEVMCLWQKHLQKAAETLGQIRIYRPRPDVSAHDRWALRYAAVIFLVTGLAISGGDATLRVRQALTPDIGSLLNKRTAALDLWITPPEYTHAATVFLSAAGQGIVARDGAVQVPEGSILKLRLSGYRRAPKLLYAGKSYVLTEATPGNFTFEMPLHQNGDLNLTSWFRRLGRWPVIVAPDAAPDISILGTETTARSAVRIIYKAHDDHGIVKLTGIIGAPEDGVERPGNRNARFDVPAAPPTDKTSHVEDLTAHPWAGLPVTLTLEAEDGIGQKSSSAPHAFLLPERAFTSPVARRVIDARRSLLWARNILSRRAVAENLAGIAAETALAKGDIVVFLSLSTAARRLIHDSGDKASESAQNLLWDVALRLDDGGLSLAQRELRDALQKMSQALNDENIPKQQLQDILDDVQEKMRQYVQALADELQQRLRQGKKLPVLSPALAQKFMKNIDLNEMLEQMRRMAQANSRDEMQKMADSLKNALDGLDMKKFDLMQEKQMQAMAALQNLEEIIIRQQKLFDRTNKTKDPADAQEQGKEQSAVRRNLGSSLHELGETTGTIPDNFAKADQSMKLSGDALDKSLPKESLPHQKNALDELQKGLDDTVKQMAQSMQQSILSFGLMPDIGNYGAGYDPLGRQSGGTGGGDIKIPSEKERRHVQEIIEELRRRSNEPDRAKTERDYIDRLLDRF
ncbi:MAG: DUF4175 family protein [Pseudomonadota bacterium]